ncbi:MAG: hypothetical protein HY512_01660 [Candidatus Aenigmarchaeota archaeon]|nr:hypothetical protein [Candidatus Aenigmarchaeota archaeon]
MDEKKIELFVIFQEKLGMLINDRVFREEFFEPILYSGFTDELLERVIDHILEDEEMKTTVDGIPASEVKSDLKVLLKKLIERFTKYKTEPSDDYIG